jgi:hypothetical protein
MSETAKPTPGPWKWQGEDYRCGWGWQILVGPSGEGLIVGCNCGEPSPLLRAYMALDPKYCVSGIEAEGKERVDGVHVFSEANARLIAAAPDLLAACEAILQWYDRDGSVGGIVDPIEDVRAAVNKAIGASNA